jgi:hypothetical protein
LAIFVRFDNASFIVDIPRTMTIFDAFDAGATVLLARNAAICEFFIKCASLALLVFALGALDAVVVAADNAKCGRPFDIASSASSQCRAFAAAEAVGVCFDDAILRRGIIATKALGFALIAACAVCVRFGNTLVGPRIQRTFPLGFTVFVGRGVAAVSLVEHDALPTECNASFVFFALRRLAAVCIVFCMAPVGVGRVIAFSHADAKAAVSAVVVCRGYTGCPTGCTPSLTSTDRAFAAEFIGHDRLTTHHTTCQHHPHQKGQPLSDSLALIHWFPRKTTIINKTFSICICLS